MRYDEDANHKLFWAIAVALVGVTCMIIATGCSNFGAGQRVTVGKCDKIQNPDEDLNSCLTRGWRQ